jgi:hypothetical protein
LKLRTGSTDNVMQQVCDGATLWIYEDLAGSRALGQVDVGRLRDARPKSQAAPAPDGWLSLGGLPKLLAALDASFQFGPVSESRLDELRVWTLQGHWEPWRLVQLLPDQKQAIESGSAVDLAKLSPRLPDTVFLHIGCDDFFPYRIEYWRTGSQSLTRYDPTTRTGKALVVMELYEVQIGAAIDAAQFAFQPGDMKPVDRTAEFLERFGLESTNSGASRRGLPRR